MRWRADLAYWLLGAALVAIVTVGATSWTSWAYRQPASVNTISAPERALIWVALAAAGLAMIGGWTRSLVRRGVATTVIVMACAMGAAFAAGAVGFAQPSCASSNDACDFVVAFSALTVGFAVLVAITSAAVAGFACSYGLRRLLHRS
jgi:hypothetical protein